MGNCCSYVLKFDHSNPVSDPVTLNEVRQVCETENKGQTSPLKKSPKKKEKPPKNGGLILSSFVPADNDKKKPSVTSPTANSPTKENQVPVLGKTQTLMVEPQRNCYLQGGGSRTVEGGESLQVPCKSQSLNPEEIMRKDGRALTAQHEEPPSPEKKKPQTKENIHIEELKINDQILKKINKLNALSTQKKKEEESSPIRSQTLGGENELFEDVNEATIKREEIKKSLMETKENIEKKLEKKPSKNMNEYQPKEIKERSKSIDKRHMIGSASKNPEAENPEQEGKAPAPLPRKSLLKRFKTIGDDGKSEKSPKKKVKFKDLFDAKGKKKVKRLKR